MPAAHSFSSTSSTVTVSRPPCGIASRALTHRFSITCSICAGSAITITSDARDDLQIDFRSDQPAEHRLHAGRRFAQHEQLRLRVAWRRLNASSWRVRLAPRCTDSLISAVSAWIGSPSLRVHQDADPRSP